jgi:hypothetical protein
MVVVKNARAQNDAVEGCAERARSPSRSAVGLRRGNGGWQYRVGAASRGVVSSVSWLLAIERCQ